MADDKLFELEEEEEEDDLEPEITEEGSANSEELVPQPEGSPNTTRTAGILVLIGLVGWLLAGRFKNKKGPVGTKNFKPVDFGF